MLVVTDGAVDLPPGLATVAGIRVVPGGLWFGDEPFGDTEDFWALLRRGRYPSTTPPTIEALTEAYRGDDGVCAVHVSGDLSATVARGREAAAIVGPDVNIIDTRSLSVGSGLVAAAICRVALDPDRRSSILRTARELPDRLHTFVLVQNAEPLRRSGRAGLLPEDHLKRGRPLVLSVRGRSVLLDQVRDRTRAVRELVAHTRLSAGPDVGAWALGHGDASDWSTVVDEASRVLGVRPAFTARLDPTVGAHVGPDAIVIAVVSGPVQL